MSQELHPGYDQSASYSIGELDHVRDLVVLRIDNEDLAIGNKKVVRLDLRYLLRNLARHRLHLDVCRDLIADGRTNVGRRRLGLHVLDDLADDVTLLQREID